MHRWSPAATATWLTVSDLCCYMIGGCAGARGHAGHAAGAVARALGAGDDARGAARRAARLPPRRRLAQRAHLRLGHARGSPPRNATSLRSHVSAEYLIAIQTHRNLFFFGISVLAWVSRPVRIVKIYNRTRMFSILLLLVISLETALSLEAGFSTLSGLKRVVPNYC